MTPFLDARRLPIRRPVPTARVTPTDVPRDLALPASTSPRLAVLGGQPRARRLLMSRHWTLLADEDAAPDVAVLFTRQPHDVTTWRARHPDCAVLVVPPQGQDAIDVVALLDAGADGCASGDDAQEVQAHVTALMRRTPRAVVRSGGEP